LAAAVSLKTGGEIGQFIATFLTLENLTKLIVLTITGILACKIAMILRETVEKELEKITD
jgi:hypothetical protein